MTSKTYTIEHQRLVATKGYVACEPHQACRVVIREVSVYKRHGKRFSHERNYRVFTGTAAAILARLELDKLVPRCGQRPATKGGIDRPLWGRSLTTAEYLKATGAGK